ncbi:MAG: SDR family oxidoreductase [Rhodospirillaceae bacterium]|jgi:3-oxoacyl-[acyl-carrier protein] reductase|nr:SDR family oxidoreductase [Rhodospirillaceae bacterium]MBT5457857.1 SDR family oxidoreductase [Rhodospirillaceae bacterium]
MTAPIFTKDIRLDGRIVLMTGGGGVLGGAMADALLQAGASVLLADVEGAAAESAARDLAAKYDGRVAAVTCDITKEADCDRAVSQAVEIFGGLHVLVNNAGKGPAHMERAPKTKSFKFWEADPDAWREIIDINVCGTYLMARAAAPHLVANGWGRIVNISTGISMMQRVEASPYGVSKAAIESETMIWAQDLAGTGVTVNSLQPGGAIDTPFFHEAGRKAMAAQGRKPQLPSILAPTIVWLASEHSDSTTGGRFVSRQWDESLPVHEAAAQALEIPALASPEETV